MYFSLRPGMKIVVLLLAHLLPFNIIKCCIQSQSDPCIRIAVHGISIYDSHKSAEQGSHGIFAPHHATQRWRFRHYNVGNCHMCSIRSVLRCFLVDIDAWLLQKLYRENIENKNSARCKDP